MPAPATRRRTPDGMMVFFAPASGEEDMSAAPAPEGRPASVSVLLVEDDEVIRRSVALALERYGYRVTTAADGLSGLERFREGGHDVLLLDVMLPHLDGVGLCRRVRETSTTPVLMLSARGDALDVVSGLEAGADDYVVKPVDTAVLVGPDPLAAAPCHLRRGRHPAGRCRARGHRAGLRRPGRRHRGA